MLLKFKDYGRIYKVINSIIKSEGGDPSACCVFFGVYGANILSKHYKINATPKAGLAVYHIGNDNRAITFGEEHEGSLTGENKAFHCWIEANGWVIDFMAPAFPQLDVIKDPISSKMFHKPLSDMASSPYNLKNPGDFFLHSTSSSTDKHLQFLSTNKIYKDLDVVCSSWYVKPPKKIPKTFSVNNSKGDQITYHLSGNQNEGTW